MPEASHGHASSVSRLPLTLSRLSAGQAAYVTTLSGSAVSLYAQV